MAGNTRGRIKERFQGMHKNYDWVTEHCQQCLSLIGDKNPKLSEAIVSISKGTQIMDDMVQDLYSSL